MLVGTAYKADVDSASAGVPEEQYLPVGVLREQYREYVQIKAQEITERKVSRHYYHADQWTSKQIKVLKARGQNPITKNRIWRKINGIVGVMTRMRSDPKAYPRTPKEEQRGGADIATAAMRYVLDNVDWRTIEAECTRQCMVDGIGGVERELVASRDGDSDLHLNLVESDTFFYDPKSIKLDFSDAMYMGVAKTVPLATAKMLIPHKAAELESIASKGGGADDFYFHSEREKAWSQSSEKRIPLIDHWYLHDGKWCWCLYSGDTVLDEGESPFHDDQGKSEPKFIMFSAACDHDGDRYGFVRNMKSPQDEINHMSSKRLHLVGAKTVKAEAGAVKNVELARREITRADGWLEVNPGKTVDIIHHDADIAALTAMFKESLDEIENQGPNPALLGQGVDNSSGRAIHLLQQSGLAELGPFISSYEGWQLRVFRGAWNTATEHFTAQRLIRITDSDELVQFIEVNGIGLDEYGNPALINALGDLDVDIKIDRGPNTMNVMQDTYDILMTHGAKAGQPLPPDVLLELIPGIPYDFKKNLLEKLAKASEPDPLQEQAKQVALEQEQAKTGKVKADTFKATADGVVKIATSPLGMGGMQGLPGMEQSAPPQMPATSAPSLPTPAMSGNPMPMGDMGGQPDFTRLLEMQAAMPPPQTQQPMQGSFGF